MRPENRYGNNRAGIEKADIHHGWVLKCCAVYGGRRDTRELQSGKPVRGRDVDRVETTKT